MMTVDSGNAFVLDLRRAKIATPVRGLSSDGVAGGFGGPQTVFSGVSLDDFTFGAFPDALLVPLHA